MALSLVYPLGASLERFYVKSLTLSLISQLQHKFPDLFTGRGTLEGVLVTYIGDVIHVAINATVDRETIEGMQSRVELVQKHLAQSLQQPVHIKLRLIPVDTFEFEAGPKESGAGGKSQ